MLQVGRAGRCRSRSRAARRSRQAKNVPRERPRDPADDLADQVAVRDGVVPVRRAGLPERGLGGQGLGDGVPGPDLLGAQPGIDRWQAGLVRQQVADGHVVLAGLGELGPIGRHGRVHVELTPLGQQVGAHGRRALGRGEDDLQRVGPVRGRPPDVERPTDDVDDLVAVDVDAEAGSDLTALREVGGERVPDGLEAGLDQAVDYGVGVGVGVGVDSSSRHAASAVAALPIRNRKLSV